MTSIKDAQTHTWTISSVGSCDVIYLVAESDSDTIGTLTGTMPTKVGKNYTPKNNRLLAFVLLFSLIMRELCAMPLGSTPIMSYM